MHREMWSVVEFPGHRLQSSGWLTSAGLEGGALESPAVPEGRGLVHNVSYFYSFQGRSLGQSHIHLWQRVLKNRKWNKNALSLKLRTEPMLAGQLAQNCISQTPLHLDEVLPKDRYVAVKRLVILLHCLLLPTHWVTENSI